MRKIYIVVYYLIFYKLPKSTLPIFGKIIKSIRTKFCSFFIEMGSGCNIENRVYLGDGSDIHMGNYSGLGSNLYITGTNLFLGNNVIMAPNVSILGGGHIYDDLNIPIRLQGNKQQSTLIIEDDV